MNALSARQAVHVARLRGVVGLSIREFVRSAPSSFRLQIAYALAGGRRTRGVACLLACEAVSGSWHSAVRLSTAVELMHKAAVISDDVADGDDCRRGRATFHVEYGIPTAVAVSDFLLAAGLKQAQEVPSVGDQCLRLFVRTFQAMASGQLIDVVGGVLETPGTKEWASNHLLKTGSLAALAFEVGAIAGGASTQTIDQFSSFGGAAGVAFQLLNDVRSLLDIEEGRSGAYSDLRNGKITPLISWARQAATPAARAEIDELLNPSLSSSDDRIARLRSILIEIGAQKYVEEQAVAVLAEAKRQLSGIDDSLAKQILYDGCSAESFVKLVF
jgi:geranylgeranyl pyrophosphate synthase